MEYDANMFKAKANKIARNIWLVFSILLTANYGSDVANGLYNPKFYVIFLLLCWIPFASGQIFMKVKGADNDLYRYDLWKCTDCDVCFLPVSVNAGLVGIYESDCGGD